MNCGGNNEMQIYDTQEDKRQTNNNKIAIKDETFDVGDELFSTENELVDVNVQLIDVKEEMFDIKEEMFDVQEDISSFGNDSDECSLCKDPYVYLNMFSPISSISNFGSDEKLMNNSFISGDQNDDLNQCPECARRIDEIAQQIEEDMNYFPGIYQMV